MAPADDPHVINADRHAARGPMGPVKTKQIVWCLPIRWWEPDFEGPDRCMIIEDSDELVGSHPLVFSYGYGHTVYLDGADLFLTVEDARAEMTERTRIMDEARDKIIDELMERILAEGI